VKGRKRALKMKNTIIYLFFFLLFVPSFSAQEELPEEAVMEETSYDYTDQNNYQNPEFYRDTDSDPSQWDWMQVNWAVFDYERADVYDVPEFYANLPVERYSDLDYRLVPDFELYIPDHSLIDGNKFVQDFGCVRCSFETEAYFDETEEGLLTGEADNLIYDADGSIYHTIAGQYIYPGEFPAGVSFLATFSGFEVRYPAETTVLEVPEHGGWYTIAIEGREMQYAGNMVSGYLSFRESQPYVKEGRLLTINGISVSNFATEEGTDVYFDGLEHEGDYISLGGPLAQGGDRIIIESTSGNTEYSFLTGNDFFDVPPGEDGDVTANALRFEPGAGARINIQDRSAQNLIPEVLVLELGAGTRITNGANAITFGGIETYRPAQEGAEPKKSTPLAAIFVLETERSSLAKTFRRVFDADNNFILGHSGDIPQAIVECPDCTLNFRENLALTYDHYSALILERYGISFVYENQDSLVLHDIVEALEALPPAVRESIRFLTIVPDGAIQSYCMFLDALACTHYQTRGIVLPESFNRDLLEHEGAHALSIFIEANDLQNELEEEQTVQKLLETYGSLESVPQDVWVGGIREAQEHPEYFFPRWRNAIGGEQFYEVTRIELGVGSGAWRDGSTEPRFGCFTAYACTDAWEDIAETAEGVRTGETGGVPFGGGIPVRDLLNPTSNFYQSRMGQEVGDTGIIMTSEVAEDWARRSRARVEVVYDEGFITEEDYETITRGEEQ